MPPPSLPLGTEESTAVPDLGIIGPHDGLPSPPPYRPPSPTVS